MDFRYTSTSNIRYEIKKTLSGLQREKIEEEYNELMKLIAYLKEILASETLVFNIIKEELLEIKDKFGDERQQK